MEKSSVRMVGSAEFRTYSYFLVAAKSLSRSAEEHAAGSNYCRVSAILFAAFAVEACLNHIGEEKLCCWDIVEPKLQWEDKLKLIAQQLGIEIDKGRRPFQTAYGLFKIRNKFAHGKTQAVDGAYDDPGDPEDQLYAMDPPWLKCWYEKDNVQRAIDDMQAIIELLLEKAGFPPESHRMISSGMYYEENA
jgi:hypothetical protein